MRNLVEKQLSWLALLVTAFYSFLPSCRGQECGQEELVKCARPLEKITNNNQLSFVTRKEELEQLCPDLESGLKCINSYTVDCMRSDQREQFNNLYSGINLAIKELCQDGPYQDNFLRYAPCMQKVRSDYEQCSRRYKQVMQSIEKGNQAVSGPNGPVKSICCAFEEYLECSHNTVRRQCGEEAAEFTKDFLDRMSRSLMIHCKPYTHNECSETHSGSSTPVGIASGILTFFVLLVRYFT